MSYISKITSKDSTSRIDNNHGFVDGKRTGANLEFISGPQSPDYVGRGIFLYKKVA